MVPETGRHGPEAPIRPEEFSDARMETLSTRLDSILDPPASFAEGGAVTVESPHTRAAFELALRLGVSGLMSTVWRTRDGVCVLHGTGAVRRGLRRTPIARLPVDELPDAVMRLEDLYQSFGDRCDVFLHLGDPAMAADAVAVAARYEQQVGLPMVGRLWLAHPSWEALADRREALGAARLVDATRLSAMTGGPERRAAALASAGVDATTMPYADWTGGLSTLFHRFDVLTVGTAGVHDRMLDDMVRMGLDAVAGPHPDRVADAFERAGLA